MSKPITELALQVRSGDRRMLAKALTLIESRKESDRQSADLLLDQLNEPSSREIRIAVTGAPGAGKSTFIEALGCHYCARGRKVAVLTIDPSSEITGGSILGDKSRMPNLAAHPSAFVRPSPSRGGTGGVASRTREAITVCVAAGYNVIIVETLGTGQTEIAARAMTDFVLLLLSPGSGDELQGIKRGIVEIADAIVVNKADGDLAALAGTTCADYAAAHQLMASPTPGWETLVTTCSALEGKGIAEIAAQIESFKIATEESGAFAHRRKDQAQKWLHSSLMDELKTRFLANPAVQNELRAAEESVWKGRTSPRSAAREVLDRFGIH